MVASREGNLLLENRSGKRLLQHDLLNILTLVLCVWTAIDKNE